MINKHLPQSIEAAQGHMHQTINNIKSTKTQELNTPEEELMKLLVQRKNTVFTKIIDHKRKIATYLTGKFPVTSNRGNKYLFVIYYYDINCILIRPMKSIADSDFIRLFTDLHEHLITRGGSIQHIRDWTMNTLPPSKENSRPRTSTSDYPPQECISTMQQNRQSAHSRITLSRGSAQQTWTSP